MRNLCCVGSLYQHRETGREERSALNNSSENGKTYWLCFKCQREAWRDAQKEMKSEQIGECVWKNAKDWQEQKAEEGKEYKRQCQERALASLWRRGSFLGNDSGDTTAAMDTSS